MKLDIKSILGYKNVNRLLRLKYFPANTVCSLFPIRNTVILESNPDLADNTYQLYLYMIKMGLNKKMKIIWLVDEPSKYIGYIIDVFTRSAAEVNSDNTRLYLIYNGLYMVLETFGAGVGCGQCYYWLENRAHFPVGSLRMLHNWWIEILASFGIIIFIAYLIFYIKMSKAFYKEYKTAKAPRERALYLSITAFMVAFVIASLSASSNFTSETLWVFWALCITLQGFNNLNEKEVAQ